MTGMTQAQINDAAKAHGFLDPNDYVAISFWIISIAMVAATVFFLMESTTVGGHWKTSMNVGALVTLVAGVHYFYMREFWVQIGTSPILYRYIDWSITVPLQMIEFYLILAAVQPSISSMMFWRLLIGTVIMLASGYCGEAGFVNAWIGFIVGMAGWGAILFEIFAGEAGQTASGDSKVNDKVKSSFNTMRFIVTAGWSIYPLGYFFGYLMGGVDDNILNLVYNLADLVNKIAFCLAIWACAKSDDENWAQLSEILSKPVGSGLISADGVAGGFNQVARDEAATKLIGNHSRVVGDICNSQPKTQTNLTRVSSGSEGEVDKMLREVARRLLGRRPGATSIPAQTTGNKQVWQQTAAYLAARTQSTDQQCPGRKADFSQDAAAAFLAVVKEVAETA